MKVLVLASSYFPEVGAGASRLGNMAEGLVKRGAEVEILAPMPNYPKGEIFEGYKGRFYKKDEVNGVVVHHYWTYPTVSRKPLPRIINMFAFALSMWAFAFKVKTIRSYSHVVLQTPPLVCAKSAMLIFKGLYGKKVVLNVSDLWPSSAVEVGAIREGSASYKYLASVEHFLYKKATAIQGQSNEIISYIKARVPNKPFFLYRNLQPTAINSSAAPLAKPFKIVFAGLSGVAQDILGLIKNVDFKALGVEFHIYGGGNQIPEIKDYLSSHPCNVFYHGILPKAEVVSEIAKYNASIVPLVTRIYGAVPSKIFDLLPIGVPILFCGGGEGAQIINEHNLGYTSNPSDYKALEKNIAAISSLPEADYLALRQNCLNAAQNSFCFDVQMDKYMEFLKRI